MYRIVICVFLLSFIFVKSQNIFFDCKQEIFYEVIQKDLQKAKAFLATETNGFTLNNGSIEFPKIPNLYSQTFWQLNSIFNKITIDFSKFETGSAYYIITGVAIRNYDSDGCQNESAVNSSLYTFTYFVDGMSYQINDIDEVTDNSIFRVNINPVTVQSISIQRVIPNSEQYCVQYEIFGCPITTDFLLKVPIIEYDMSIVPVSDTNSDYTGLCEYGKCIGGVGKLIDGNRGEISNLELNKGSGFNVFTGDEAVLYITVKLSHYFYISSVRYYYIVTDINDFSSGKLENETNYTIDRKDIPIDRPIQVIVIEIPLNSSIYLAISEVEIIGQKDANIQNYFTTPYQPQICSITANNQTVAFTELIENSILIFSVGALAFVLCLLALVVISLLCVIIYIVRGRKYSENRLEELIKNKLHESTMNLAQNRLATYADINEDEIKDFRKKLRERLVSEEYVEMDQLFPDKSDKTDDQLFSSLMKQTPQLFPIDEQGTNSDEYDSMWRSNK